MNDDDTDLDHGPECECTRKIAIMSAGSAAVKMLWTCPVCGECSYERAAVAKPDGCGIGYYVVLAAVAMCAAAVLAQIAAK